MTGRASVVFVDDHRMFAESVVAALRGMGLDSVALDPSMAGLLGGVDGYQPELVVVDLAFGGDTSGGLRLIEPLRRRGPRVLVLRGSMDRLQLP